MRKPMMERAAEYRSKYERKRAWQRAMALMAAFVVFFTSYAMALPADTPAVEAGVYCGLEEHQHAQECYEQELICEWVPLFAETPVPLGNAEAQVEENRELTCGLEETEGKPAVIHTHGEECYTVSTELTCGLEETEGKPAVTHTHGEECYTVSTELTCGLKEGAGHAHSEACIGTVNVLVCKIAEEGHVHTEACYKAEQGFVCGKGEGEGAHAHTETCYAEIKELTCGLEEGAVVEEAVAAHGHTDTCYTEIKELTCGLEEGAVVEEAVEAHIHTDACYTVTAATEAPTATPEPEHIHTEECYEQVLVCEIPEHTHELICYSDPNADVETSDTWRHSVRGAKITGVWASDLVAVAKTQIGYRESTKNYQVSEAGEIKGYTRYGAWCGQPYDDWSTLFVNFCLSYANVPRSAFPRSTSCTRWVRKLNESGLYVSRGQANPKPGDIVFFSNDHMGIVSAVSGGTIHTIEGDCANAVATGSYSTGSGAILGYGIMPENPALVKPTEEPTAVPTEEPTPVATEEPTVETTEAPTEEPTAGPTEATEEPTAEPIETGAEDSMPEMGEPICGLEESEDHQHGPECFENGEEMLLMVNVMTLEAKGAAQPLHVSNITGENAKYDSATGVYSTDIQIDFAGDPAEMRASGNYSYVYEYPKEIAIPDTLLNQPNDMYDGNNEKTGTYIYVKNEATGTYSVHVDYNPDYVQKAEGSIPGHIRFGGRLAADTDENGDIKVDAGGDLQIWIESGTISYPGSQTDKFDISVGKSGNVTSDGKQLVYTVEIKSDKGTPDPIQFNDVMTGAGIANLGTPTVKVEQGTYRVYSGYVQDPSYTGTVNVTPTIQGNNISMTLDGLGKGVEQPAENEWSSGYTLCNCYRVTYTYDLSNIAGVTVEPDNTVTVSASDNKTGQTVTDNASYSDILIDKGNKAKKAGDYDSRTGRIKWTIQVNGNNNNITGAMLTDDMFKDAMIVDGKDIDVQPAEGVERVENGGIKFTEVNGAPNTNSYIITYYTRAEAGMDDTAVPNDFIFDPTPDDPDNKDEIGGRTEVIIQGVSVRKSAEYKSETGKIQWTITVNENQANIAGAMLTDDKLANATDLTIDPNEGYEVKYDENDKNKITGIDFTPVGDSAANTNTYTITYSTTAQGGWDGGTETNVAVLHLGGKEITDDASVYIQGGSVEKACGGMVVTEDNTTGVIAWTVKVTVPESGLPVGAVITDGLVTDGDSSRKDQFWTAAQVVAWGKNMTWSDGTSVDSGKMTVEFLDMDGTYHPFDSIQQGDETKFTSMRVTFPDGLAVPNGKRDTLTFTYNTTADLTKANIGDTTYRNDVNVQGKTTNAQHVYKKGGVIKTDGSDKTGTTDTKSDGTVTWKVKVKPDEDCDRLTVTDHLPAGVVLENITLSQNLNGTLEIGEAGNISATCGSYVFDGSYDSASGEVQLNMTHKDADSGQKISKDGTYVFTFNCRAIPDSADGYAEGETHTFENTVDVETDKGPLGSSTQTQNWTYEAPVVETKPLDKNGVWDNSNRRLNYTVEINPKGEDFVTDAYTLTVKDDLTYADQIEYTLGDTKGTATQKATLVQNSVKLYRAVLTKDGKLVKDETANPVRNWKWTCELEDDPYGNKNWHHSVITVTGVPDGVPLILEYAYMVTTTVPEKATASLQVWNDAELSGTYYKDHDDRVNSQWQDATTIGWMDSARAYTFFKVEENNYGKPLAGAEFTVYECNVDGTVLKETEHKYTTGEDGKIDIKYTDWSGETPKYAYNTLYMMKETKAPEGYLLPDPAPGYYFYFSNVEVADPGLLNGANLPEGAFDLAGDGKTEYVENTPTTTSITVNKEWFNAEGNRISKGSGSINFDLYQIASDTPLAGSGSSGGSGIAYKVIDSSGSSSDSKAIANASLGSTIEFTVKMSYDISGWKPEINVTGANLTGGSWNIDTRSYTGTAEVTEKEVVFKVGDSKSNFTLTVKGKDESGSGSSQPSGPSDPVLYGSYTIDYDADRIWSTTITDLPKSKTDENGTVYYGYRVVETSSGNWTPGYVNNDGIASGVITIQNTETDKPSEPTVQKKLKDANDTAGETTDWQDSADYDIGDEVPFQLKATLASNVTAYETYKVIFHDTMSAGLDFCGADSVAVKIGDKDVTGSFKVDAQKNADGTTTLTFSCDDVKAVGATDNSVVTVEYKGRLNENAEIGSKGNPNEVYLEYSSNPAMSGAGEGHETKDTPKDVVIVFTYKVEVNKVAENPRYDPEDTSAGAEPQYIELAGAGFTLSKKNAQGEYVPVGAEQIGEGQTTFTWVGLDDGDYKLSETTKPLGYIGILDIEFRIEAGHIEGDDPQFDSLSAGVLTNDETADNGAASDQTSGGITFKPDASTGTLTTDILNLPNVHIPDAGGTGTAIFYMIGSMLMLGAIMAFGTKRRANVQK